MKKLTHLSLFSGIGGLDLAAEMAGTLDINPDVVCDFTDLPFPDNSFPLVVFDPPHLTGAKETAWLVKKYGKGAF